VEPVGFILFNNILVVRSMKKFIYISLFVLTLASSCIKVSSVSEDGLSADLELCFSVPEMYVTTKGLDDPWDEDMSDWLVWHRLTDGREIYQMTLMLIEESTGDLVAFRDFYKDSGYNDDKNGNWSGTTVNGSADLGTEFKATFNYDTPQNERKSEKLVRGKYLLIAMANYAPFKYQNGSESIDYAGLKGAVGNSWDESLLDNYITAIEKEFLSTADGKEVGIKGFMDVSGNGNHSDLFKNLWLFNIVLAQDTDEDGLLDNVGKKQPQPLTLVKHLELHPGLNKFDCQLERTYVRVRVEIENNSGTNDLSVYDLKFCDWFTQRAAYLLNDPDSDRNYDLTFATGLGARKGAPDLNTNDAIVKFTGTESAPVTIAKQNSKVIYDGYVFGSRLGKNPDTGIDSTYSYTLNLEYEDASYDNAAKVISETAITTVKEVAENYKKSVYYYLMQPIRKPGSDEGFTFEADNGKPYTNYNLSMQTVKDYLAAKQMNYVWCLEKKDGVENAYYIKNAASEDYLAGPQKDNQPRQSIVSKSMAPYFTFSDYDQNGEKGVQMLCSNGNALNQANFDTDPYGYPIVGWTLNDGGAGFRMFPVSAPEYLDASFNQSIPLELIDPATASPYLVKNIKRNDFINILVTVTYNADKADLEVSTVLGWVTRNEEIEFH